MTATDIAFVVLFYLLLGGITTAFIGKTVDEQRFDFSADTFLAILFLWPLIVIVLVVKGTFLLLRSIFRGALQLWKSR